MRQNIEADQLSPKECVNLKRCPYCGAIGNQDRFVEEGTIFNCKDVAVAKYTHEFYYCRDCKRQHHASGSGYTIRNS